MLNVVYTERHNYSDYADGRNAECRYAECHTANCSVLHIVML
jgi:hypothetical protein